MDVRKKGLWVEARRQMLDQFSGMHKPLSQSLTPASQQALRDVADRLSHAGISLSVDADRLLSDTPDTWHMTVHGPRMANQPVSSMADLRTLDSLYGNRHAWGLPMHAAAATLGYLDSIGLTFMRGGQPVGAYGALQGWTHQQADLKGELKGREIDLGDFKHTAEVSYFDLGGPSDGIPHEGAARVLTAMAHEGLEFNTPKGWCSAREGYQFLGADWRNTIGWGADGKALNWGQRDMDLNDPVGRGLLTIVENHGLDRDKAVRIIAASLYPPVPALGDVVARINRMEDEEKKRGTILPLFSAVGDVAMMHRALLDRPDLADHLDVLENFALNCGSSDRLQKWQEVRSNTLDELRHP